MQRILIVRLGALGDLVHTLPVVAALRERWPDGEIDWVVDARHAPLLDLVPALNQRIAWRAPSVTGAGGLLSIIRRLRRRHYDVALDVQGLLKSAVLARLSGARRVIGFSPDHLKEPAAKRFYREIVEPTGKHIIEKNLSLLRALDIASPPVVFPLIVPRSPVADRSAELLNGKGHDGFALLNPGAGWPNKRWVTARFGLLAKRLQEEHGMASLVLWGPGEQTLGETVVAASEGAARLAPPTSIADALDLCDRARVVISGDTAALHFASATGTPTVGLIGPTDPARNGPWGPHFRAVSRYDTCACHYQRMCSRAAACLEGVNVAEVASAVGEVLESAPTR